MSRDLALGLLAALALAGGARAEAPSVAADIAPVHSLVARVMDGAGIPALVLPPGSSPHGHAMRPSEAAALQDADLVFWIGPELTPWLGDAIASLAPDADAIVLLDVPGTTELGVRDAALFEPEENHHADDGHAHGPHDPHAWLDPLNARVWLGAIAEELARLDPGNAAAYRGNAAAGQAEIDLLVAGIEATLAPVRGHGFFVFHDAYQYFEQRFDLPAAGAIALSDATRPGPARLQAIRAEMIEAGVTCILAEPQFNAGLVETVLDGTGARSATVDPLGAALPNGPGLYPRLLSDLAAAIAGCLDVGSG